MRLPPTSSRVAIVLGLMLSACDGDDPAMTSASTRSSPGPTETTSTTTTTSTTALDDQACSTGQSSPAQFEAESGQYAVYLTGVEVAGRRLSFDVIQFLVGDDAARAYHRDVPDDPEGPPNDYYIANESKQVRQAPFGADMRVRLVRLREDSDPDLDPGTFAELPAYLAQDEPSDQLALSSNPFWLTVEGGAVTDLCEQYVP